MRRTTFLKRLPVVLLAGLLALVPAGTAVADDVYREVKIYGYEGSDVSRVTISGDLLAVTTANPTTSARAVEVMRVDEAGTVLDSYTIQAPEGAATFGGALTLEKSTGRLYVGAYGGDGAVYEYLFSDAGGGWRWNPGRVFRPETSGMYGAFGESLFLRGDRLAVGAYRTGAGGTGAAYVVNLTTGVVERAGVRDLYYSGGLGDEVLLTDRYLIANDHMIKKWPGDGTSHQTGGVYVWELDDLSEPIRFIDHPLWGVDPALHKTQIYDGPGTVGGFGYQLAATETELFVSSPAEVNYTADDVDDPVGGANDSSINWGTSTAGAIYRFSLDDFHQVGPRIIAPPTKFDLGMNMTLEGNALLASGTTNADGRLGQVHVYDISTLATVDTPGDLMRQQVEPVQVLQSSDARRGDVFGSNLGGALRIDGGRAIVASSGSASSGSANGNVGKAYLFSPIIPNVVERPMTLDAPSIVYGQEGRIAASVPGLGVQVTVNLDLDGDERDAETDAAGTAEFLFTRAQHPAGTYPVKASFVAPGGRDVGSVTGEYVVRKAPTAVEITSAEVR